MKKKGNFLSGCIALLILFSIISYMLPTLIKIFTVVFCIGGIAFLAYIVLKSNSKKQAKSPNRHVPPPNERSKAAKRQVNILLESTALVNDSNNLEVVLHRYQITCDTLNKLTSYTDEELRTAGYRLKEPLANTLRFMESNKTTIINQAIERNVRHEVDALKTSNGKAKKLDTIYNNIKNNHTLTPENISFLDGLYCDIKNSLDLNNNTEETKLSMQEPTYSVSKPDYLPDIAPEIADLVWIGDGENKNYVPASDKRDSNGTIKLFQPVTVEEPSALYLSLPISKPPEGSVVERPPYYPIYKDLIPEQRWLYWEFLSSPFSQRNNIGYVFLFYYGLERHMLCGNLDKAFSITLRLRECYDNASFQNYSSAALTLTCIAKQRSDLALKLLESDSKDGISYIPLEYLLLLKYTFQIPLTKSDIIRNHKYFGFDNTRYIKNQPELFSTTLSELLQREFGADAIDLGKHFPMDLSQLPVRQERMFANMSLNSYEIPFPVFRNHALTRKVLALLEETHETVKIRLREMRKENENTVAPQQPKKAKLSPIESEKIPKKLSFDLSDIEDWNTWSNKRILETFYALSNKIQEGKEILPKLEACEKSYKILKPVINIFLTDPAGLPPIIYCRDYGAHTYARLGNWEDAKRVIKTCLYANAYEDQQDGESELEHLIEYRKVAQTAIEFIQNNPGFLQKNIYTALKPQIGENQLPILKEFMRETYVFHKQPYKGSNQLYFIERE